MKHTFMKGAIYDTTYINGMSYTRIRTRYQEEMRVCLPLWNDDGAGLMKPYDLYHASITATFYGEHDAKTLPHHWDAWTAKLTYNDGDDGYMSCVYRFHSKEDMIAGMRNIINWMYEMRYEVCSYRSMLKRFQADGQLPCLNQGVETNFYY